MYLNYFTLTIHNSNPEAAFAECNTSHGLFLNEYRYLHNINNTKYYGLNGYAARQHKKEQN